MTDLQTIPFKGRDISVKKLNETQKMLLVREAQVLRSNRQEMDRKLQAIATMINIVESALVDGDDREYLMELAGTGQVEFKEMLEIATAFDAVDGEVVAPTRAVRRAATKRR